MWAWAADVRQVRLQQDVLRTTVSTLRPDRGLRRWNRRSQLQWVHYNTAPEDWLSICAVQQLFSLCIYRKDSALCQQAAVPSQLSFFQWASGNRRDKWMDGGAKYATQSIRRHERASPIWIPSALSLSMPPVGARNSCCWRLVKFSSIRESVLCSLTRFFTCFFFCTRVN